MRTEEEIRKVKEGLTEQFGCVKVNMTTVKSYYDQSMSVGSLPDGVEIYTPPTAREAINSATDHIMSLGQKVTVPRWSDSEVSAKLKSRLEGFGEAFLKLIDKTHRNIRRNCMKHGLLYGMFCVKGPLYEPRFGPQIKGGQALSAEGFKITTQEYSEVLKDFDNMCDRTFPFIFRTVHPLNVMFDMSERPEFVVESFKKKAIQVSNAYPDWDIGKREPFEDVEWWEYWDLATVAYFADDKLVAQKDNPYGFIPYEIGIAGFGEEAESPLPEEIIVSLIAPALTSYKMEARLKTAIQSLLEYEALGRWIVEQKPGDDFDFQSKPGSISTVPAYYKMKNEAPVKISEDAWRFLQVVQMDTEKVLPQMMQGMWSKGVTSGYMGALSVGQARLRLDALKSSWENAASKILDHVLFMIKNVVMEPVGILGNISSGSDVITVKPTELQPGKQHFYVNLDAESPEDKDRRIMLGMELQDRHGLSNRTVVNDFYGYDPEYESDQKLVEDALNDPNVKMQLAISIMKEIGMNDVINMINQGQVQNSAQAPGFPSPSGNLTQKTRSTQRLAPGTGELGSKPEQEGFSGGV